MEQLTLIFTPLGGAGEFGMNRDVYGYGVPGKERLIVVDSGGCGLPGHGHFARR